MEINYWYIPLVVLTLINITVSLYLMKRGDLEPFQKGAQIVLVWLLPFVAAIGLWLFHRSQDVPISSSKSSGGDSNTNITGSGD